MADQCSICQDAIISNSDTRSTARLRCGHVFHLDCIGSEFNIRGAMKCPNCRTTENGDWRYAAGGLANAINEEEYPDEFFLDDDEIDDLDAVINQLNEVPEWYPRIEHQAFLQPTLEPNDTRDGSIIGADLRLLRYFTTNRPTTLGVARTTSGEGPNQRPHASSLRFDHRCSARTQGESSGSSHPSMDDPYLTRFQFRSQQLPSNSPSPMVRTSMSVRMGGSDNPEGASSSFHSGNVADQIPMPREN